MKSRLRCPVNFLAASLSVTLMVSLSMIAWGSSPTQLRTGRVIADLFTSGMPGTLFLGKFLIAVISACAESKKLLAIEKARPQSCELDSVEWLLWGLPSA